MNRLAWLVAPLLVTAAVARFVETFELAPPGKPYPLYSRALLKRVRR